MINKYLLICIVSLSSCSLVPEELFSFEDIETMETMETNNVTNEVVMQSPSTVVNYYDKPLTNNVNDYAQWLVQDLFSNIDFPQNNTAFMVADLAILDSDLNKTNLFGRQMSEAILHEVHQTGFSTIDMRTTGFIRMTEEGDLFSQTRDYQDLDSSIIITNVIAGTLTRHRGGYLLNVRAVDINSKILIASAQIFVPYNVVDSVMHEEIEQSPQIVSDMTTDPELAHNASQNNKNGIPLKKQVSRQ